MVCFWREKKAGKVVTTKLDLAFIGPFAVPAIIYFFNNGDVVFGFLTLFCLLVPGYFGKRHLLKNKEFFQHNNTLTSGTSAQALTNKKVLHSKTGVMSESDLKEKEKEANKNTQEP